MKGQTLDSLDTSLGFLLFELLTLPLRRFLRQANLSIAFDIRVDDLDPLTGSAS